MNHRYENLPVLHILKIPDWQTWEAIHNITETKTIKIEIFKIKAHSRNTFNETADILAKETRRLENSIYIDNNEAISRIYFTLACYGKIIEKNPRRFVKLVSQNFHRGA